MNRYVLFAGMMMAAAAIGASPGHTQSSAGQITILYDAFGPTSTLKKDWGFSALIEYGDKRILFDTGNNAEIFAHNVAAKGVDLRQLDFAVISHRHGDHTSGLNHLLKINPAVKIFAPQENFGVFGAALPGTFYRSNESLPADMRYFDGRPPETLRFGSPWPDSNFTWISKTTEVAPGFPGATWAIEPIVIVAEAAERRSGGRPQTQRPADFPLMTERIKNPAQAPAVLVGHLRSRSGAGPDRLREHRRSPALPHRWPTPRNRHPPLTRRVATAPG